MLHEPETSRVAPPMLRVQQILRTVLLVPEAPLIAFFLVIYLASDRSMLPAILACLPIAGFVLRMAALQAARAALERAYLRVCGFFCRIALFLHPWSADTLALCGALALVRGDLSAAEQHFRQSLRLLPNQPTVQAALSGVLLERGRPAAALDAAYRALALDSRCAVAYLHLAEAERMLGVESHQIEDRLRSGLRVAQDPHIEAALRYALVAHLYEQERRAEAALMYRSIERLLPRCSEINRVVLQRRIAALNLAA